MDHSSTIRSENIDSIIPVYEEISRAPIQKYKTASSKNKIIYSLIFQVYLVVSALIFGIIFGLIFSYWIKQSIILEMISNPTSFQIPNVSTKKHFFFLEIYLVWYKTRSRHSSKY